MKNFTGKFKFRLNGFSWAGNLEIMMFFYVAATTLIMKRQVVIGATGPWSYLKSPR